MSKQATLKFSQNENTFKSFYPGSNEIALHLLKTIFQQSEIFCMYLWGPIGIGKTHLLKACAHFHNQLSHRTAYFSCKDIDHEWSFSELEHSSLICLDDFEKICQNPQWEEAIFNLYNHIQGNQGHLILSGTLNPQLLNFQLPDLKSRIAASFSIELKPLSDEEKLLILKTRSAARGFDLPEEVMSFIITHFPRDMGKLISILDQLDEASLTEKRLLTVPFIKKILQ